MGELRGEAVVLRPIAEGDRERAAEILAAPEVARWWADADPDAALRWVLSGEEGLASYVIEAGGDVVGLIQSSEETDPQYRSAGIDIAVDPALHGRGVGSDAIRVLARHLFSQGHHRVTIDPAAANERAIAVYTRLGFRPIGVSRASERGADGVFHDQLLMDLLEGELR